MYCVQVLAISVLLVFPLQGIPTHPQSASDASSPVDYRPYEGHCALALMSISILGFEETLDFGIALSGWSQQDVFGFLIFCENGANYLSNVDVGIEGMGPSNFTVLSTGGTVHFYAMLQCGYTHYCPSGVIYEWSLSNPIGVLNSTTGNPVTFTAGGLAGHAALDVVATMGDQSIVSQDLVIKII